MAAGRGSGKGNCLPSLLRMRDHVIIYDFRCAQRVNYENLLKLAPNSNRTHSDPNAKDETAHGTEEQ